MVTNDPKAVRGAFHTTTYFTNPHRIIGPPGPSSLRLRRVRPAKSLRPSGG